MERERERERERGGDGCSDEYLLKSQGRVSDSCRDCAAPTVTSEYYRVRLENAHQWSFS